MKIIQEFKEFAIKGNVVDMAVGIIIGGAFGKIVTSLVSDIIMPPIGMLIGGVNFNGLRLVLKSATVDAAGVASPEVAINYGAFIQVLIKGLNMLKKKKEEAPAEPAAPTKEEILLTEIRDLLKNK